MQLLPQPPPSEDRTFMHEDYLGYKGATDFILYSRLSLGKRQGAKGYAVIASE